MTNKDKLKIIIATILFIGFTAGYIYGLNNISPQIEREKTGYEILQEGYERVGEKS